MRSSTNDLFDNFGRVIPLNGEMAFSQISHRFYQIFSKSRELSGQIKVYSQEGWLPSLEHEDFIIDKLNMLLGDIAASPLEGLLKGTKFPFFLPPDQGLDQDIGTAASRILLPQVKHSFEKKHSPFHFQASLQGQINLELGIKSVNNGGHDLLQSFLSDDKRLVGWIFPEALIGYSLDSQLKAYQRLEGHKTSFNAALGGIHDVSSALIATPDMLINPDTYPPVLCLGGIEHADPRYFFNFKAHGKHLEFWGMPRALTKGGVEQVSEQWSGVISIFNQLDL